MSNYLDEFMNILIGVFDNSKQNEKIQNDDFPLAKHINNECSNLIKNKPSGVRFLLEENIYVLNGFERKSSHLFSFQYDEKLHCIVLKSYKPPYIVTSLHDLHSVDFKDLSLSKQLPTVYFTREEPNVWKTDTEKELAGERKFILKEIFKPNSLTVKEEIWKNGVRIFGFDSPIIYNRVINLD